MSDIFENDIESQNEFLEDENFEDADFEESTSGEDVQTFPKPLFCVKLEYSGERIFATGKGLGEIKRGDKVVVPTRYGKDFAVVLGKSENPFGVKLKEIVAIERKMTADDLARQKILREKESNAFDIFRQKAFARGLDMKLILVHFLPEESKVLFFFSSENRVDFRELVKDLVSVFKMRIELRQIGARDESRITGGLGICGREYCCRTVNDKLHSVSIKMAKEQNLSLNSAKISGQCGRLLCCLAFESDWYEKKRKNLPYEGLQFFYDGTNFKISDVHLLTNMIKLTGEDGRLIEVHASRFSRDQNGKWHLK